MILDRDPHPTRIASFVALSVALAIVVAAGLAVDQWMALAPR